MAKDYDILFYYIMSKIIFSQAKHMTLFRGISNEKHISLILDCIRFLQDLFPHETAILCLFLLKYSNLLRVYISPKIWSKTIILYFISGTGKSVSLSQILEITFVFIARPLSNHMT
jgi:hypothetical protein